MSLKANVRTDSSGNITVHMNGGLDIEYSAILERELESLMVDNPTSTITLDMNQLDFVGSSGIGKFVSTINEVNNRKRNRLILTNVHPEFKRVFKLFSGDILALVVDEFESDDTRQVIGQFGGKKRGFQN